MLNILGNTIYSGFDNIFQAVKGWTNGTLCAGGGLNDILFSKPVSFVSVSNGVIFYKNWIPESISGELSRDVGFDLGCGLPNLQWSCTGSPVPLIENSQLKIISSTAYGNAIVTNKVTTGINVGDTIEVTIDIDSLEGGSFLEFYPSNSVAVLTFNTVGVSTQRIVVDAGTLQIGLYNVGTVNGELAVVNSLSIKKVTLESFDEKIDTGITSLSVSPIDTIAYSVPWVITPIAGDIITWVYDGTGDYKDIDNVSMVANMVTLINCLD